MLAFNVLEPSLPARACVIWMHGLGSSASNMMGLVEQFPRTLAIRHVCVDAPMRPVTFNNHMRMQAWYDIIGFQLSDREDREGIEASELLIGEVIEAQLAQFSEQQVFLAGFSQGGAMALFAGLRSRYALGGLISLSGYLPLSSSLNPSLHPHTPIFIGSGSADQVVLPAWTAHGAGWLRSNGYDRVETHEYPMEHTVCYEEIKDIAQWLMVHLSSAKLIAEEK